MNLFSTLEKKTRYFDPINMDFLIMKISNFQVDFSNISAERKSLMMIHAEHLHVEDTL